jgi:hypothetical protein
MGAQPIKRQDFMSEPLWRNFELAVTALHQEFGIASHNVKIKGKSGVHHQIDAVLEKNIGIYPFKMLVSCKHWNSRVKKEHLVAWHGIVDDCSASGGSVFSRVGFQSGAITYAKHHGIKLFEIKDLKDSDWEGYLKQINVNLIVQIPQILKVEPEFEKQAGEDTRTINVVIDRENGFLYNEDRIIIGNFVDDINQALSQANETEVVFKYENSTSLLLEKEFRKIKSVKITLQFVEANRKIEIDYSREYPYQLIERTTGQTFPISKEGIIKLVTDDIKKAIGSLEKLP